MSKCLICGSEMKTIPAGVSKSTGKPYQAFQACPNKCKQPSSYNQTVMSQVQAKAINNIAKASEEKKWEEISTGKVRHGVALEAIKLGKPLSTATANWIIDWTNFIMTGKLEDDVIVVEDELRQENIPF